MRGNFSLTKFPTSEKGALWMQQGRPLLDSDWNAQITLAEEAVRKKVQSLIGTSGAPAKSAGFALTPIAGLSVNEDSLPQKLAEGLFLEADPSLPFPLGEIPARPFHIQLGFSLHERASGGLCHVPGLFLLSLTKANRLTIAGFSLDAEGVGKKVSVTGKSVIAPHELTRIDIIFDGENISVFLDRLKSDTPEVSLPIGFPDAIGFDPLALILGCVQKNAAETSISKAATQGSWFKQPLKVSFWHLSIIDDFLEFARQTPLGSKPDNELEGLVCSLEFTAIVENELKDQSPFSNNGLLLIEDRIPSLTLLDVMISAGNYIAHGRFYQNATPCLITEQPNLPAIQKDNQRHSAQNSYQRFYLDCWQRLVTDLEAPANHDLALGSIDTTASLRNIWQVKSITAASKDELASRWKRLNTAPNTGQIRLRRPGDYLAIENGLLRVEIHHSGWAATWPICEAALPQAQTAMLEEGKRQFLQITRDTESDNLLQLDRPVLLFVTDSATVDGTTNLENADHVLTTIVGVKKGTKYYRVSLADAAPKVGKGQSLFILPVASYKFSTKNGCLSYPVSDLDWLDNRSGLSADLSFPGYNGLEIKNGDWLELGNLAQEQTEQPGPMFQVENFMPDRLQLLLTAQPGFMADSAEKISSGDFPTLTIWGESTAVLPAPPVGTGWNKITNGIELEFSPNSYYRSGQYWTAALRSAAPKGVVWPGIDNGIPVFCDAEGPQHQYVSLADLKLEAAQVAIKDKRQLFRSLVDEPFADLDDKTAKVLRETALFMEMIGLPGWQLTPADLPDFLRNAVRRMLHELYNTDLRIIGVKPDAPQGLKATGQKLILPDETDHSWRIGEEFPEDMQGDGFGGFLAGQPVYINQKDNGIWTYHGPVFGWELLAYVPDDRHAYSVAWDNERLYIVGGRRHGLITEGAAKHVIALNSVGEWHTVGTMRHYTGYPSVVCVGDNLLVAGGIDFEGNDVQNLGYVDLKRRQWHSLDDEIPSIGAYAASIAYGNQWLIFGGEGKHREDERFQISDRVRLYDPVTRAWQDRASMPVGLAGHQVYRRGEILTVFGGKLPGGEFSNACYNYNLKEDCWCEAGFMSEPRAFFGLLHRTDNRQQSLAAVGGMVEEGLFSAHTDISHTEKTYYLYE